MQIRQDAWLSDRFGHPLFSVVAVDADDDVAAAVAAHAAEQGAASYQSKAATEEVGVVARLTAAGFGVVNTTVTLARAPGDEAGGAEPEGIEVVESSDAHGEALLALAERSFSASRFHLDPAIPDRVADAVKRAWVQSYLDGSRGEGLLVALREREPVGFLAVLAVDDGAGEDRRRVRVIDLTAVAPEQRGAGAGAALVDRFLADARGRCELVRVGSQAANERAIAFYEDQGFRVESTAYDLHLHVGDVWPGE